MTPSDWAAEDGDEWLDLGGGNRWHRRLPTQDEPGGDETEEGSDG